MLRLLLTKYWNLTSFVTTSRLNLWTLMFQSTFFLKLFFWRTELIWQEGLLLDFLQKKSTDRWVRRFLTVTGYLVSERFFFEWVVRFYLDLVVWPFHKTSIVEFTNVGSTLFTLILLLATIYVTLGISYLALICF